MLNIEKYNEILKKHDAPMKVLIVDDEKWVRETFKDFCNVVEGIQVDIVENGQDALQKIKDKKYDLVTVDLIMPEISGLDLLTEIKILSPHLPVIIITGNATDKLVKEAGILGACKVMYKPVEIDTFLSELITTLIK